MASVSKVNLFGAQATTAATTNSDAKSLKQNVSSFIAFLKASAVNGATTVNAKVQHSPDNGTTWFDVVSFTALVGVAGSESKYHSQFTVANMGIYPLVRGQVALTGVTLAATIDMDFWYDENK